MSSFIFGAILTLYGLYQIVSKTGVRFYIDEVLWALCWGALFLFNGAFGYPYNQSVLTNTLIFLYVLTFILGHKVVISPERARPQASFEAKNASARKNPALPGIFIFTILCAAIGMGAPYELLVHGGQGVASLTAGDYGDTVNNINGEMKQGLIEQSMLGKISFAAPQASLILLGIVMMLANFGNAKRIFLITVALAPLLAFTVVSTLRSPLFLGVLLLVAAIMAGMTMQGRERTLFKTKYVFFAFLLVCALAAVLVFFQSVRMGTLSLNQIGKTFEKLRLWVAGYIPAFNGWLWSSWNGHLTWGSSTFRFLAQLTSNRSGALTEVGSDIYVGNYTYGNACTSLKGVVNDFGLIGCGVFLFVWGVLSRAVLAQARRGSIVWGVFFACDLAAIVWSPNAFFFLYGSRVLAPVLALAYIGFRRLRLRLPAKSRLIDARDAVLRDQPPKSAEAWRRRNANPVPTRPRP